MHDVKTTLPKREQNPRPKRRQNHTQNVEQDLQQKNGITQKHRWEQQAATHNNNLGKHQDTKTIR